jgi:hypothetical protein
MRDGVWTDGRNTETQAWISGENRTITVTPEAIEAYLQLSESDADRMTPEERRTFVERNLGSVIAAANRKAEAGDHAQDRITIRRGEM